MIKIIIDYPSIDLLFSHQCVSTLGIVCVCVWLAALSFKPLSIIIIAPSPTRAVLPFCRFGNGDKSHHANSAMKVSTLCLSAPSLYLSHCFSGPSLIVHWSPRSPPDPRLGQVLKTPFLTGTYLLKIFRFPTAVFCSICFLKTRFRSLFKATLLSLLFLGRCKTIAVISERLM